VRDNENDGGTYMIRVCHSFHGADHGYPYLYYERPEEALPPLADLGRGSSAGGVCYLETAFPPELQGGLLFCEWGRSVVRYERRPAGSGFAPMPEIEFAAGAANDPYGFKPTDLVVDHDGSLLVSDWADGQRPKRGRGRIYRIAYAAGKDSPKPSVAQEGGRQEDTQFEWLLQQLDSPSYYARLESQLALERHGPEAVGVVADAIHARKLGALGRCHAVWILTHRLGQGGIDALFRLAESDPDPAVRAQAVRALADLTDPVLVEHRLDARRGDERVAARLAALASGQDPRVVLEILVSLGRLRWHGVPDWLCGHLTEPDAPLSHAAMQALRRSGNWPGVLKLLDLSGQPAIRSAALRAIAGRAEAEIVNGLVERLQRDPSAARRGQYAELLARVHRKSGPWVYWGYRPGPRPANTVDWERTGAIEAALDGALGDRDAEVRALALRSMQREQVPTRQASLSAWLQSERDTDRVAVLLEALRAHEFAVIRGDLERVVRRPEYSLANRLAALEALAAGFMAPDQRRLLDLAAAVEDGPVLARILAELGARQMAKGRPLLLESLDSKTAVVRASALESLAKLEDQEARSKLARLLEDDDPHVRRAAAAAAGMLKAQELGPPLFALAEDPEPAVRAASLVALGQLGDSRAMPLAEAALEHPATQLAALDYVARFGGPQQAQAVSRLFASSRSHEILAAAIGALANWEANQPRDSSHRRALQRAIASLQGASGVLLHWTVQGPMERDAAQQGAAGSAAHAEPAAGDSAAAPFVVLAGSSDADGRVELNLPDGGPAERAWVALSDVWSAESQQVQFLASSSSPFQVWLNGRRLLQRDAAGEFRPDSQRVAGELRQGANRVALVVSATGGRTRFHVRFRRLASSAEHERLAQLALQSAGNTERGKELFFDAEKSLCLKCHRLGERGERIGPELTGIGSRFSRVHLIESILDPSRAIAPSYETVSLALADGRVLNGVKVAEDSRTLTLADEQARTHVIAKAQIEERQSQPRSTMPEGLEKRLTDREFLDLIAFLAAQKKASLPQASVK
jgi:putative heme-binding domain-containing protein